MGNATVTLTDEIYAELVDGLKTRLDWSHFLAKHGASKGPLYNAHRAILQRYGSQGHGAQ